MPIPNAPPPSSDFLGGRLLIAMPGIGDPRFERAVVLMCAHTPDHAVGLILNHPIEGLTLPTLFEQLDIESAAGAPGDLVLYGGPVDSERGFVLHTDDYRGEEPSVTVWDGVALTATREVLQAIGDHDRRPRRALLALGYAGWGAGQLEREIQESVWLTCEADEDLLFSPDHARKWAKALGKIGVSPAMLSATGGTA